MLNRNADDGPSLRGTTDNDEPASLLVQLAPPAPAKRTVKTTRPAKLAKPKAAKPAIRRSLRIIAFIVLVAWGSMYGLTALDLLWVPQSMAQAPLVIAALLHLPYALILVFFTFGFIERIGYFLVARRPIAGGVIPRMAPRVCVQLPMFNEQAVAARVIEAAAAIDWPRDRFEIQVLDDSTHVDTREMVRAACAAIAARTGVTIHFIHRTDRSGYKAGALEAARHQSRAEYFAIFDADFLPPADYLAQAMPHFYDMMGKPIRDLALVQAQWGHLNDDQSMLTAAQALWVDDHHTLQQSWRSVALSFVNFTGTAGVWKASALDRAGGWSSSSLVEDCEISFRILFAGYRTRFVKELVAPAELPQSIAAYRSQQKRWTQGWVQLQRLHLRRMLFDFDLSLGRKACLTYMMCISWQWPLWLVWIVLFPFLIANGLAFTVYGPFIAMLVYLGPAIGFAIFSGIAATFQSTATYADPRGGLRISPLRRLGRIAPFLFINAGMLPHHACAFLEGLFGPMHAEFERTPKTAQMTGGAAQAAPVLPTAAATRATQPKPKRDTRAWYLAADAGFAGANLAWIILFLWQGQPIAAIGATWLTLCIVGLRVAPACSRIIQQSQQSKGVTA